MSSCFSKKKMVGNIFPVLGKIRSYSGFFSLSVWACVFFNITGENWMSWMMMEPKETFPRNLVLLQVP